VSDPARVTDDPDFGPLSRPMPAAVAAFRHPEHALAPLTDPAISHGLTDAGQARRFVERFGDQFRFDHSRRAWLRWSDHFFSLDRDGEPKRAAIELARNLYLDAGLESNLKVREAVAKFAIQQQARRKVEDVLELAKVMPPIADGGTEWNSDPFLLATRWGVVDLRTRAWRDGRPDDRITLCAGAKFDPSARCDRWRQFLDEIFGDETLIAYLQRALGYSTSGDVREQVVWILYGNGANGKSTLLETIAYVLGDYAYATPFSTFEAGQRSEIGADVAALAGRRFVRASETNSTGRLNESRLKALSGGDRMNARHLYGNPFEFNPVCKIWLGVNHRPSVTDDSLGFWRRIHLIPFTRTFSGSAADKNLTEALRAEASGILNWLVDGAVGWQRDGLAPPPAVFTATDEYRHENDPLAEFLDESCILDPDARCAASQLFTAYEAWCDRGRTTARERLGRKAFGSAMTKRFESRHTEVGKLYLGIGLTDGSVSSGSSSHARA